MKKNYKKVVMIILMLSLVFTLSGCGAKNSPEATVDTLFKSVKGLDFEKVQTLVDSDAKAELEERAEGMADGIEDIDFNKVDGFKEAKTNLKKIMSDLKYKVTDINMSEDVAVVTVDVDYVDGSKLVTDFVRDIFGEIMGQALSGGEEPTEEESMAILTKVFNTNYKSFETVLTNETLEIHLIKNEEGEWLITELKEDLLNALTFNAVGGLESSFSGMFDGF